jgi:hypothetical protein
MDPNKSGTTNMRRLRKRLIITAVTLAVGTFVWFFWFQTGMLIEGNYLYRHVPIAKMRPVALSDHSVTLGTGTKLSAFGYDFEVPWQDVDTDNVKRKAMVLIPFHSGLDVLVAHSSTHELIDTAMSISKLDLAHFRAVYGDEAAQSDYKFLTLAFNTTPDQASLFDSKADVARKFTLVLYKSIIVPGDTGIFEVQTPEFRGFQYGDPSKHPKRVTVSLYSASGGVEFSFAQKDMKPLTISQADINRVIQTAHQSNTPEAAPSSNSTSLHN